MQNLQTLIFICIFVTILFYDKKLKESLQSDRSRRQKYGDRASAIKKRLDEIEAANSLDVLLKGLGWNKPLKGEYKGKFSCRITGNYRLIYEPYFDEYCEMSQKSEGLDLSKVVAVKIVKVEDYH